MESFKRAGLSVLAIAAGAAAAVDGGQAASAATPNVAPVCAPQASSANPAACLALTYLNSTTAVTSAPLGQAVAADTTGSSAGTYLVNWGDGSSYASSMSHTYTKPGHYTVKLMVTFSIPSGLSSNVVTTTLDITNPAGAVTVDNHAPKAGVDTVHASFPTAPALAVGANSITATTYDFGDGTGSLAAASHVYQQAGTYTVTATVTYDNSVTAVFTDPVAVLVTTTTVNPTGNVELIRYAGANRYDTGVKVSSKSNLWANGAAQSVILARGDGFADALAGIPLATYKKGPLLLTPGGAAATSVDPEVLTEIQRVLGPAATTGAGKTVYVLGGDGAISPEIAAQLKTAGYNVVRFGGADRAATALAVATDPQGLNNPAHVVVARGDDFADALAAGPYASGPDAVNGVPAAIVLSSGVGTAASPAHVDAATAAYLQPKLASQNMGTVVAIGGGAAKAVASLPGAGTGADASIVGQDRYDTAGQVATRGFPGARYVGVVTGTAFADALTGGAYMAAYGQPLVLTNPKDLGLSAAPAAVLDADRSTLSAVSVFGGTGAVPAYATSAIMTELGITTGNYLQF